MHTLHRQTRIVAAIEHGVSNAPSHMNTQMRLLTRRAFGFHGPDALIAWPS